MEMEEPQNSLSQVTVNPQEASKSAEADLNFLSALVLGDHMLYLFPAMFIAIWEFLKSKVHLTRDFSQLAIGIPRAFAKTTFIKIFIVYCVLFTTKKFILVISSNEDHAINIIRDVCEMLAIPNILAIFGDFSLNIERDQAQCKIFKFRSRRIILAGFGAKGSVRGLNIGLDRPDVMIFEDYQTKAESENEELSKKLYQEMLGTHMKSKSPFGCLFIFIANMYPTPGSILKKLKSNKDWTSFIVGGILSTGESLWEELQPLDQLLSEYEKDLNAGHPEIFLSEVLNDENAGIKAGIDITKIPRDPFIDELPQGQAILIDPSLDNPTSDYNGIGLMKIFDGKPVLAKVKLKRYTPFELIKQSLILGIETGTRLICVENIAYQASLLFWFAKICTDNGITGFQFMPLNVGGKSKNAKIMATLKEVEKAEIFIGEEVRPLFTNEVIKFNPLKKNNSDTVLDLATFMKKVIEQYLELTTMVYEAEYQMIGNCAPRSIEENCSF
jgi:hypothetical protein